MKIPQHKHLKTILLTAIALGLITAGSLFWHNEKPAEVKASWWNESWQYRQAIEINKTVAAQANVYVTLTLNTFTASTSMQADCGDFRFVTTDGKERPYYIVSGCRSATNVIHVFYDAIEVGRQTLYFYYGNPSAENGFSAADFATEATNYTIGTAQIAETGPGPVGYWSFDEGYGTTANDGSGQGNHGTITGATWQDESMCVSGKCLFFDGTDDYVDTKNNVSVRGKEQVSLALWLKPTSYNPNDAEIYFEPRNDSTNMTRYELVLQDDGRLRLGGRSPDGGSYTYWVTSSEPVPLNQWAHVYALFDATNDNHTIYINGVLKGSGSAASSAFTDSAPVRAPAIAASVDEQPNHNFEGFIDEVKIYPYARSAEQVKQDYAAGLAGMSTSQGVSASFGSRSDSWMTDGLVGYWRFDEPAGTYDADSNYDDAADSSGNGNTGSAGGNASTTAGKFGNGLSLNGDYDKIAVGSQDVYDDMESLTIAVWIYARSNGTGGWGPVVSKAYDVSGEILGWVFSIDGYGHENLRFLVDTDGSDYYRTAADITLDQWHYVVATWDGTLSGNGIRIFIDGNETNYDYTQNGSGSRISDNSQSLMIGNLSYGGASWDGYLDEVRVYNRALSADEVRRLYEWAPGPVAWWKMDDHVSGDGQTIIDSSASTTYSGGNHGTTVDGANNTGMDCSKIGKYGTACEFDGVDDYVYIGDKDILENQSFLTVCAWAKTSNDGPAAILGGQDKTVLLAKNEGGDTYYFAVDDGSGGGYEASVNGTTLAKDGSWHHVCGVYNSTSDLKLYIDGISEGTVSGTEPESTGSTGNTVHLGTASLVDGYEWQGLIDDVRIYNYARTQKQILEDMNGGRPAIESPVLHLTFDEGYGSTAYDSSIHKNNGALSAGGSGGNSTVSAMWDKNGKFGGAMEFDGTNDYVELSDPSNNSLDFGSDSYTLSAWFKTIQAVATYPRLISKGAYDYHDGYGMQLFDNGTVIASIGGGGVVANSVYIYGGTQVNDGLWHLSTAVFDRVANTASLFIDGKPVPVRKAANTCGAELGIYVDISACTSASASSANDLAVGKYDNGSEEFFNGLIDDVRIYNFALSADDVKTLYNSGISAVMGAPSTGSGQATSSFSNYQAYCVPGDTAYCAAPVGEWKFDEMASSTAYDTSGNGNNGILGNWSAVAKPAWDQGRLGGALRFDGTDDIVMTNYASPLTGSARMTLEAWVKPSSPGELRLIAGAYDDGPTGMGIESSNSSYGGSDDLLVFITGNDFGYTTTNILLDNEWKFLSMVYDGTKTGNAERLKLFINGTKMVLNFNGTIPATLNNNDNFTIGGYENNSNYFSGLIDNIRLFNYARTPAQIAWEYNRGAPIAWWKFDECQGDTILDWAPGADGKAANANPGQLVLGSSGVTATGTCASSSNSFWYNGRSGKYNSAGSFDGVEDHVTVNDQGTSLLDITEEMSVSAWIYNTYTPVGGWSDIVTKGNDEGTAVNYWMQLYNTDGNDYLSFYLTNGMGYGESRSTYPVSRDQWHHVLVTYHDERNEIIYYIDGIARGDVIRSNDPESITMVSNDYPLKIGNTYGSQQFHGLIDEVKIFNYALTPEQVKTEYAGGAVRFE